MTRTMVDLTKYIIHNRRGNSNTGNTDTQEAIIP